MNPVMGPGFAGREAFFGDREILQSVAVRVRKVMERWINGSAGSRDFDSSHFH